MRFVPIIQCRAAHLKLLGASIIAAGTLLVAASLQTASAQDDATFVEVPVLSETQEDLQTWQAPEVFTVRPAAQDVTPDRIQSLSLPGGFEIELFAEDLENPRIIAVASEGYIYVSERDASRVRLLGDTTGDGRADVSTIVAEGLDNVHGLAANEGTLWMVGINDVWRAPIRSDGLLGEVEHLRDDLPNAGQHPNRTIRFGPDGAAYLSIGSTTNAAPEEDPRMATLLRGDAEGELDVFAEGLRNFIGYDWHPATNQLWGMDHNSDGRGNELPPEELNQIQEGAHYGWPFCYGNREVDWLVAQEPEGTHKQDFCATTEPMVLAYDAHSAPMQFVFYDGDQFPEEYRNDAFVTLRGSWNRNPPVGYEVVRLEFDGTGEAQSIEPFISDWLIDDGRAHFGRLVGLAVAPDGSLLIGDDTNGVIYRVSYGGE